MLEPKYLLLLFVVIFLITFRIIWKKDVFIGGVYFFLFIYSIFSQIGYYYFPELSQFLNAYFGEEIFYKANIFITLSFVSLFLMFYFFYPRIIKKIFYGIRSKYKPNKYLFYLIILIHLVYQFSYFVINYNSLDYTLGSRENVLDDLGLMYVIFAYLFKLSVAINLLLYFLIRVKSSKIILGNRHIIKILFIIEILLFIFIAIKLGSRTDPLGFLIGLSVLEILIFRINKNSIKKNNLINILKIIIVLFLVVSLNSLSKYRNPDAPVIDIDYSWILFKDYYAPAHILFASIYYDYIDPIEVLVSNLSNSLVLLKQPYLQANVMDLFVPGIATRSASYAFYIFTEGFLVMGFFGFIYNGIIIFSLLMFWRMLANTNSIYYNLFIISLLSTQMANLVRGQSSYFIKDIYFFFIPVVILFFIVTGLRPFFIKNR